VSSKLRKPLIILLLASGVFINGIDRVSISSAAPLIIKQFRLNPALMGVILSAFFWPYTLLQFPAGRLADLFGAKRVLGWSAALWSAASAATGWAPSFFIMVMCRLGVGAGEAAAIPTCNKVVVDNFESKERGMAVGWYQASLRFSYAMTPLLMAFLLARWGWRNAFYITGIGSSLWCLFWYCAYRDAVQESSKVQARQPVPWKLFLLNRTTVGLCITKFCMDYLTYLFITWLPGYLVLERGFSIIKMGIFASLPWLAGCGTQVAMGYFSDWLVRKGINVTVARKSVQVCLQLCAATVIIAGFAQDAMLAAYLLIFCVGVQAGAGGHYFTMLAETAPRKMAGSLSGIANTCGAFAGILSPIVTGLIVKSTGGFKLALAIGGCMALGAACAILFVIPELKPMELDRQLLPAQAAAKA
jgi:ACS family glucarate transporter-like MFS transporter